MDSMIVCPEPLAAAAGQDVFANGGNAIDAAVAAAFVQGVTNPFLCGLGGTGLMFHHHAKTNQSIVLDCETTIGSRPVPESWQKAYIGRAETVGRYILQGEVNQIGHQSVLIPGFVRGCWEAIRRFGSGKLDWSELLSPAIELAKDGFAVYPYIAKFWQEHEMEGRPGYPSVMTKLRVTADTSRIYLKPDGAIYEVGDRLLQPEMANTIQRLADAGGEDFYSGEIGRMIRKDFDENDGFIIEDDLRDYAVLEKKPLIGHYRGFEIRSAPFSSNGPSIIQMLHILEHFDLPALGHNSAEYIDTLARVQRAAFVDNVKLKCMGLEEAKPLEQQIISLDRAAYWADRVKSGDRLAIVQGGLGGGTTHLTCIDAERNIVSFTHSIGSVAGSGVVTPGLGFLYNNFLGHYNPLPGHSDSIVAGKRFGGGVPTIIFRDDEPILAVGAPGGSRLITSTIQSIVNVIDHGMDMDTAVSVPRFHSEEQQLLFIEPSIPKQTALALQVMGNDVRESTYMSRVQAIRIRSSDGALEAGADPRGGAGVGYHLAK